MMLALTSPVSLSAMLPELIMAIAACAVLIAAQANHRAIRDSVQWITLAGIILAGLCVRFAASFGIDPLSGTHSGLAFDDLAHFVRLSTLVLGVVLLLVAWSDPTDEDRGEFFCMFLLSLVGLMLMGSAANLLILFLALELVSVPTYVMVTISRRDPRAIESGTKYFYLGAMSAAITAYGFSFLYGVAGTAALDAEAIRRISTALANPGSAEYALATVGVLLSFAGVLFKIAAVPLHFYVADVYQGAASSVAGLLGFVPKLAGIVAIIKVIALTGWQTTSGGLFWMLWLVAAVSMTLGNMLALKQTNIKRMLAFSGVAHAGYMLLAIMAGPATDTIMGDGTAAAMYYVVIYGIANLGAFAILGLLRVRGEPCETLQDVAGLLRRYPGLAIMMALAMLALMGLPPTTGFWGKMSIFGSGLALANQTGGDTGRWIVALVIIAAVNSAIGAAYYLRVTAAVLLYESDRTAEPAPREAQYLGAMLAGFLTLLLTIYPTVLLDASTRATQPIREAHLVNPPPARSVAAVSDQEGANRIFDPSSPRPGRR